MTALEQANRTRIERAALKRDLREGRVRLEAILLEPPACARRAEVRQLLLAVPGIGKGKAQRLLLVCRIAETKTVQGLTERQRTTLVRLLAERRAEA